MAKVSQECFENFLCRVVADRLLDTTIGQQMISEVAEEVEQKLLKKIEEDKAEIVNRVVISLGIKKTHIKDVEKVINSLALTNHQDMKKYVKCRTQGMINELLNTVGPELVAQALRGSVVQDNNEFTVCLTVKKE